MALPKKTATSQVANKKVAVKKNVTVPAKATAKRSKEDRLMNPDQVIKVTVDIALFTFDDQQLKILLSRRDCEPYSGLWAYPGGHLENDEELDAGTLRQLREEAGLTAPVRLKQIATIGTLNRDKRWRSVSILYLGAMSMENAKLDLEDDCVESAFHPVKRRPRLAFDHEQITKYLLGIMRDEVLRSEFLFDFFRSVIPAADMLALVEQIWGTTADRRKWDNWMRSLPFLQEMSGGEKFRLDRTEMRRWLRTNRLNMTEVFPQS